MSFKKLRKSLSGLAKQRSQPKITVECPIHGSDLMRKNKEGWECLFVLGKTTESLVPGGQLFDLEKHCGLVVTPRAVE